MKLPQSWEELNLRQFTDVAHIFLKKCSEYERNMKLLWALSGLSAEEFTEEDPEEWEKRFPELDFLKEIKFQKSFVPEAGIYKGPEDELNNFSFNQLVTSFVFFDQYKKTQQPEDLDKLLSVLYLEGDFDKKNYADNFSRFALANEDFKKTAYLNYFGLRQHFAELYPAVFSNTEEETASYSKLNPWDRLVDDLAGPKFGKKSEVGENNAHEIFIHLQNIEERRNESEKK